MRETELKENTWKCVEKALRDNKETWRGHAQNKLIFINGVLSLLEKEEKFSTCLNWSSLDPKYGSSSAQWRKFNRWRKSGVWEMLLPILIERKLYRWVAEEGAYELLLTNGKLVRKLNQIRQETLDTQIEESERKHKEEIGKLLKIIGNQKKTITVLQKEVESWKHGKENSSLRAEVKRLEAQHNQDIQEKITLKQHKNQLLRILKRQGYHPSGKGTHNMDMDAFKYEKI